MSILTMLDRLLLGPLKLFFEVLFVVADRLVQNEGLSIIVLSLSMNLLVLPLYRRADALQAEERDLEAKLQPWVKHIKKTFRGDERYMILQTYYRQNDYKPAYALRGSLSLLLEIPFFIAAYQFLSHLELLQGVPFGPIRDLGAPDGLIVIGGLAMNLLPILMTAINIVSGAIYTRGYPLKSKLQLYGMALIFLVFLYNSPAGLVFYWTLNNLFSLVKNVFYKLKDPKRVLTVIASLGGLALFPGSLLLPGMRSNLVGMLVMPLACLALQLPLVVRLLKRRGVRTKLFRFEGAPDRRMFFLGAAFLAILTGLLIPSAVIAASPLEFLTMDAPIHPLWYVASSLLLAVGTFVVWFGVFYFLVSDKAKKVMEALIWVACGVCVVDYMFFGTDLGTISTLLELDVLPQYTLAQIAVNLAVLAAVAAVFWLVVRKKPALARIVCIAGIVALGVMSVMNVHGIATDVAQAPPRQSEQDAELPYLTLSRDGENVVVLMLDRAIGNFVPVILNEKPELMEAYDGFTYYPNMLSFGGSTNFGTPTLFGGYEYTPAAMNARADESLQDKQNEALRLMPVLFSEEGYHITVTDAPFAGQYTWVSDYSLYDDIPNTDTFTTMGRFPRQRLDTQSMLFRNFFCYSLFKSSPLLVQPTLYYKGSYNGLNATQIIVTPSTASGLNPYYLNSRAVLDNLASMTRIEEDSPGGLVLMVNNATHEPTLLQAPDYVPAETVINAEYDAAHTDRFTVGDTVYDVSTVHQISHYHVNIASLIQLTAWFDYLKANDLYDNTRIIIVSDHGSSIHSRPDLILPDTDILRYNSLLLVKDFGSHGTLTTDDTLMTLGDVPVIAMEGVIEDPVNPATGNPVTSDAKYTEELLVTISTEFNVTTNNGNTFLPSQWYSVHDNILDADNWIPAGEH